MNMEDKCYFYDMVDSAQDKLSRRPLNSLIRKCFPDSRLDQIRKRIDGKNSKDLARGYWQPLFLFLKGATDPEIDSLEKDIQAVIKKTPQGQVPEFLSDEREEGSSWVGGLFEVFAKAALLKSDLLSVDALDWKQSNAKVIDAKVKIGQRTFGVEMTTLGDSEQNKKDWRNHCEVNSNKSFCGSQDAYTQGRRLFDKVYEKIARGFDTTKSQLLPDAPNLLLVGFWPLILDLTPNSPSIGWALDELFANQPTGNTSEVSLKAYLSHEPNKKTDTIDKLLAAPSQISGILLFNRCRLVRARINYNARKDYRLSHKEMALFESVFERPPAYCCQ